MSEQQEISNDELRVILEKFNWDYLKTKKSPFIVRNIIKLLRREGVNFIRMNPRPVYQVVPVTEWPVGNETRHAHTYIYEMYRGWKGVIVKEWNNGQVDLCRMKIKKTEKSSEITVVLMKADLQRL